MKLYHIISLTLVICCNFSVFGQKKVGIEYLNDSYKQFIKHPKTDFKDSTIARKYLRDLQSSAISKGFLLASVDSIEFSQPWKVDFKLGEKFESAYLTIEREELEYLKKKSNISEKLIADLPLRPLEISKTLSKIERTYLNSGYPFASVSLADQEFKGSDLHAQIIIERGPIMEWTKVHVKGDSSISSVFIQNLIEIRAGELFDQSKLDRISGKIRQLSFVEEIKSYELLFTKEGVELFLYLRSVKVSSVNGILGVQPNSTGTKTTLTGDLNLKLLNVLKRGESLNLRWQSIREQTQSLKSRVSYPYLFKSPFGIEAMFNLYKRDTSYLEIQGNFGVTYALSSGNYIKGFYESLNTSVLSGGTNNYTYSNLGNASTNLYGLALVSQVLDYVPNPRKGRFIQVEASIGDRKIRKNDSSEVIRSMTYRGMVEVQYYIPLYKRHVLKLANKTLFYGAEKIFENELFRFGGLNSQRGFNQDDLLASTYSTTTLEYRYLLDKNTNVFAFYDISWYENPSNAYYNDTPYGFGFGFAFSSNLGMFSISYALGKQFNNPILFADSKIHFGYIAYF